MIELGGFAQGPDDINGNKRDIEIFNFFTAQNYLFAMESEDWNALGDIDPSLINDIVFWLNYDENIGDDMKEVIKNIPKGLIITCKGRPFVDAIVAEHKSALAETFILNGNHDVRLYLTAMIYDNNNVIDNCLLNYIHRSYEHCTAEKYAEFLKNIFRRIEQHYTSISDVKEQVVFLIKIRRFINEIKFSAEYKNSTDFVQTVKSFKSFEWQKQLKKCDTK